MIKHVEAARKSHVKRAERITAYRHSLICTEGQGPYSSAYQNQAYATTRETLSLIDGHAKIPV